MGERTEASVVVRGCERPWWCQDPTCAPVHNNAQPADEPGWGGFCCGKLPETVVETVHGQQHNNDGHLCIRSPRSGVTMLNVQAADWIFLGDMTVLALAAWGQAKWLPRLARKAAALTPEGAHAITFRPPCPHCHRRMSQDGPTNAPWWCRRCERGWAPPKAQSGGWAATGQDSGARKPSHQNQGGSDAG